MHHEGAVGVRTGKIILIGLLTAMLALAACGRRGPLEAPPGANSNDDREIVLDTVI